MTHFWYFGVNSFFSSGKHSKLHSNSLMRHCKPPPIEALLVLEPANLLLDPRPELEARIFVVK